MQNSTHLLNRLREGDESAFRQFVDEQKQRIFTLCYRILKDEDDAEDAAQEVFMKIYQKIGQFREESQLNTWVYRIAMTTSYDLLRKRKRKTPWMYMSSFTGGQNNQGNRSWEETLPIVNRIHPHATLEEKERLQKLYTAIDKLPENQKSAILLHYMEGLKYEQISEILGVSFSAVESLLFRARKNLKETLRG